MEKIVVRRLNYYLETNGFIAKEQAGFRSSRSTNQYALLSQCVKDALDNNHVLTAVFIDLKSTYDNVWREYLLLKLSKLGARCPQTACWGKMELFKTNPAPNLSLYSPLLTYCCEPLVVDGENVLVSPEKSKISPYELLL
ncbi:uncharacterized protein CEXT_566201 [Caerostris extrusa]|uniref:Reverse transcriptase domain-containing protein n=1 Tax=Caerostris extrusa TaxID=172846 RepID=A0AAV4W616_CAEEX|nr:uncharacterized protein CEXT_566201 [Caerostris extrusa]